MKKISVEMLKKIREEAEEYIEDIPAAHYIKRRKRRVEVRRFNW